MGDGSSPLRGGSSADLRRGVGDRDRGQQRVGVGVRRLGVERVGPAHLAQLPEVHHRDAVADVLHHGQVVGDEHQGEPVAGLHVLEQVEDLRLHRHVERRHRLVADDDLGLEHQRPGDADALALAAGELVGPLVHGGVGVEAHGVEDLADLGLALVGRADRPDVERLGHDLAHLAARVERGDRVLEDHLQLDPRRPQLVLGEAGELLPLEVDRPARGGRQLHDGAAGGGLAAARLAHEAEGLALGEVEADVGHRVHPASLAGRELHLEVLDAEDGVLVAQVRGAASGHVSCPRALRRARERAAGRRVVGSARWVRCRTRSARRAAWRRRAWADRWWRWWRGRP